MTLESYRPEVGVALEVGLILGPMGEFHRLQLQLNNGKAQYFLREEEQPSQELSDVAPPEAVEAVIQQEDLQRAVGEEVEAAQLWFLQKL